MKNLVIILILLISTRLFAQIDVKNQPKDNWFAQTEKVISNHPLSADSLLKQKQMAFPSSFQDTLRKYDWVDLGGYLYLEKKFTVWFNKAPLQYDFWRLDEGDTMITFICHKEARKIQHTNFKATYSNFPKFAYKKIAGLFWIELCSYGNSKEYLKLISYRNKQLIVDTPVNGKTSDKKMFSRKVYLAVEKKFEWNKNNQ